MPSSLCGGYQTYWLAAGQGDEQALFLHCSLAQSRAWVPIMEAFETRLSMVAMDMPGHGKSADWDQSRDFHDQAFQMALGRLADMQTPAHLVGHSFGATIALRIAVEHPELVKSLTLVEPVIFSVLKDVEISAFAEHAAEHAHFDALLEAEDNVAAAQNFTRMWGSFVPWEVIPEAARANIVARIGLIRAGGVALFGQGVDKIPLRDIKALKVPVLLLRGSRSPAVMSAVHGVLADAMPHARDVIVDGAGHMLPITHPGDVIEAMRDFLDAI